MNYLLPLRIVTLLYFVLVHSPLSAQNLIPNPGFEILSSCPFGPGTWGPMPATPWYGPTLGTPDIFNACGNFSQAGVPDNFAGNQPAHGGNGYAGVYVKGPGQIYREYLQASLVAPLIAGSLYSVSFYVSVADFGCPSENIGIYFSVSDPNEFGTGVLPVTPQLTSNEGFLNDTDEWVLISGCFTAIGGEQFVTIGNFASDLQTPLEQPCIDQWSYYYLDDINLEEITEEDVIVFDLGSPVFSCGAYAINPGLSGYNYTWEDGSQEETLTVTGSGTYSLTISDGCRTGVDSIEVVIENIGIDLGPDVVLCTGETMTLSTNPTNGSYIWQNNSVADTFLVNAPGTYMLTITNQCGSVSDTVVIDYTTAVAPLSFGPDFALCSGQQVFLHANNLGADFLWQDNSTTESFLVTTTGSYYLQISNACSSVSDTIEVTFIDAMPEVILPDQVTLCVGETLILDAAIPDADYQWNDNSQNQQLEISAPGNYSVTVTNACGTDADTTIVLNGGMSPTIALGTDLQLCPGESILLEPLFANVDTWLWQDGSSLPTYTVTIPGEVHFAVSNLCGTVYDTIQVTLQANIPPLDLGLDIRGCAGESITIESGIVDVTYLWQDGSTNADFITMQSGTFILEAFNNCGTTTDTIVVDLSGTQPTPALPADTTLCEGNSLILTSIADDETSIEWQDGSASSTFVVTIPGAYILSETNLCGDVADTVVVTYLDAPSPFSLGSDTTLCPDETIILSSPSDINDIVWQDGSVALDMLADQPGIYSLQISNDCGLEYDEIEISYDTDIPQLNLDASIAWCAGDTITLDATQAFVAEYLWSTGSNTPSILINSPGLYTIEVAVPCKTISQVVEIYTDPDCDLHSHDDIYIPNVFSPDGNGINEIFFVSFGSDLQIISMEGSIFDRWGNLVFSSKENPFEWDGFFASDEAMPGVYVYKIKYTHMEGSVQREKVLTGDVTLVRA